MKKLLLTIIGLTVSGTSLFAQLIPDLGGTRAGISAMTFLKLDAGVRAAAMGGAQVAIEGDGFATQWNPASSADLQNVSLSASNTFLGAGVNHSFFSVLLPHERYGNFAFTALTLNSGQMERRTEFMPNGTGEYFSVSTNALGVTYAQNLTSRFSYGVTLKYVNELLDQFTAHTFMADLGFLYRTNYKDLKFAVVLQNFGFDSKLNGDFPATPVPGSDRKVNSYPAPSVFSMGVSMIPIKNEKGHLLASVQLNHPSDNAANIRLGVEYGFRNLLFFRAGYKVNVADQKLPTFGFGVKTRIIRHPILIDYAAEPHRNLGWIHRVGVQFRIFKKEKSAEQPTETPPSTPPANGN